MIYIKKDTLLLLAIILFLVLSITGLIVVDRQNQRKTLKFEKLIEQIYLKKNYEKI
jgi:hypothetical protein